MNFPKGLFFLLQHPVYLYDQNTVQILNFYILLLHKGIHLEKQF